MKRYIKTSEVSWPTSNEWEAIEDEYEFEEMWQEYLADPETDVNDEFHLFAEPSVQGMMGGMFLYDDDGVYESVEVDFQDWCDTEAEMAADSASAVEYKEKYRSWIQELLKGRKKQEEY